MRFKWHGHSLPSYCWLLVPCFTIHPRNGKSSHFLTVPSSSSLAKATRRLGRGYTTIAVAMGGRSGLSCIILAIPKQTVQKLSELGINFCTKSYCTSVAKLRKSIRRDPWLRRSPSCPFLYLRQLWVRLICINSTRTTTLAGREPFILWHPIYFGYRNALLCTLRSRCFGPLLFYKHADRNGWTFWRMYNSAY